MKIIDSHCHLQVPAYDIDRDAVLLKMQEKEIGAIVVGTNYATSVLAVKLAEAHENLWATIAVHPGHTHKPHHDASEMVEPPVEEMFNEELFSKLVVSKKVVAIGEVGLDYYRLPEDKVEVEELKKKQKENFVAHLRFAKKYNLPLTLHVRDAYDDALEILNTEKYFNGVMHCFTGSAAQAEKFLSVGLYISLTGAITYSPRKGELENQLHSVARIVPVDRLLVETDAPWLTPNPWRGQRNDPQKVEAVIEQLAKLRGVEAEEIAKITLQNTVRLFNLAKR